MTGHGPIAELSGVELIYPGPPPVHAVRSCDFIVERGRFVAVTGASGSGKSSLLNVLGLLDAPTSGRYWLDGKDVSGLSDTGRAAVRARRIGFVFQAFHLIAHRSAIDNVALGLLYSQIPRRRRWEIARSALERVGLTHRLDATPVTLSGGERQRVAIARALAGEPSMLLCDEPTGNLDSVTAQAVLGLLDELHAQGSTIVLVTHSDVVAARAQRVMRMSDGRLVDVAESDVVVPASDRP